MADQYFEMTQKNYEDLKKELDYLVKEKRPEIIERIAEATATFRKMPNTTRRGRNSVPTRARLQSWNIRSRTPL